MNKLLILRGKFPFGPGFELWSRALRAEVLLTASPRRITGPSKNFSLVDPHYPPERRECHLSVMVENINFGITFGSVPARRTGDPGSNLGPDDNFSLKIKNIGPQMVILKTKFS